ncbi:hypothetical protein QBC47DRAFT_463042 [Echria macrotheca]|uniref:Uncharacterized protein n=1 Tax=Echria macrotheca TaxID=438768 RepID=A0AAJ0B691_9PEZI|nr:hypothetical protein QBC47DRAFT_463042 [Echria macrotheca]
MSTTSHRSSPAPAPAPAQAPSPAGSPQGRSQSQQGPKVPPAATTTTTTTIRETHHNESRPHGRPQKTVTLHCPGLFDQVSKRYTKSASATAEHLSGPAADNPHHDDDAAEAFSDQLVTGRVNRKRAAKMRTLVLKGHRGNKASEMGMVRRRKKKKKKIGMFVCGEDQQGYCYVAMEALPMATPLPTWEERHSASGATVFGVCNDLMVYECNCPIRFFRSAQAPTFHSIFTDTGTRSPRREKY